MTLIQILIKIYGYYGWILLIGLEGWDYRFGFVSVVVGIVMLLFCLYELG